MGIDRVEETVSRIADGIENAVARCIGENAELVADLVREQLYSGQDGNGQYLSPSYDTDPYFDKPGPWKNRSEQYKRWKQSITPPMRGAIMGLAPRPVDVPNLVITGMFHESIRAKSTPSGAEVFTAGFRDGPLIERKYGGQIFSLGDDAREYFLLYRLNDWLVRFYRECGYEL